MFALPNQLGAGPIKADVVIVGSGPCGVTIAKKLAKGGLEVILVEGGGFCTTSHDQALFQGRSIGASMDPTVGRFRVFGGASTRWTGRCAKFDEIDLEVRPWVKDSGWPMTYQELVPFYSRAAIECGFAESWDVVPKAHARKLGDFRFGTDLIPFVWFFSKVREIDGRSTYLDFGRDNLEELNRYQNLTVLMEANLVDIVPTNNNEAVQMAIVRDRSGADYALEAQSFVLACGGIENTRLLLNFAERYQATFSAVRDTIGRRFMQHPRIDTATFKCRPEKARELQKIFNNFGGADAQFEVGWALSPETQRRNELLQASAVLRFEGGVQSAIREALDSPLNLVRAVRYRKQTGTWGFGHAKIRLQVDLEQEPDSSSRIMLDETRDRLGLKTVVVDWTISDRERRTSAHITRSIGSFLKEEGFSEPQYTADLDETGNLTPDRLQESYHHIGGTRMSESPATGVVDRHLRVHKTENLYLAGTSVMPTGGHANPTLSVVALSLRLADHLLATHKQPHSPVLKLQKAAGR